MTYEVRKCVEWLNHYIKTDPAHKVIAHYVFGHNGDCGDYGEDWMWLDDICKQVINLIESLSAQLDQVTQERDGLSIMLTSATSAAETYKRERDAAVEDMILGRICATCRDHNNPATSKCAGCLSWHSNWQWRGLEKAVEG